MKTIPPKKAKFRDALKSYCADQHKCEFDDLNGARQSKVMTEFFVNEIHSRLSDVIPPDEFDASFIDRKDDLWMDFIYKNDGRWTIIQTKYRGVGKKEDETEILKHKNLLNHVYQSKSKAHAELKQILDEVKFKSDSFRLIFITLGKFTPGARHEIEKLPSYIPELGDIHERVEWDFLDEEELNIRLRSSLSVSFNRKDVEHSLFSTKSDGSRANIVEVVVGERRQAILAVDATQLVAAYENQGLRDQLFSLNIRNFIGASAFNTKMKETAQTRPEDFFFFNNGISCLATSMKVDASLGKVTTTGLQVINGAQTVKTLFKVKQSPELKKINVLMRITEVGDAYGASGRFVEEITEYNNSQNMIKSADFRSNDPIQVFLENEFGKLTYDAKTVRYLRKRTAKEELSKQTYELIRMEDFAKVIHAFLVDPISFSSSTKYLFSVEEGDGYNKVFGDGVSRYDNFSVEDFRYRASIWWLGNEFLKRIQQEVRDLKQSLDKVPVGEIESYDSHKVNALQAKWFVIYAAKLLLERTYKGNYVQILSAYYDRTWKFNDKPHGIWLEELYSLCRDVVVELYIDSAINDESFVHRNWLRQEGSVKKLEIKCRTGTRLEISAKAP